MKYSVVFRNQDQVDRDFYFQQVNDRAIQHMDWIGTEPHYINTAQAIEVNKIEINKDANESGYYCFTVTITGNRCALAADGINTYLRQLQDAYHESSYGDFSYSVKEYDTTEPKWAWYETAFNRPAHEFINQIADKLEKGYLLGSLGLNLNRCVEELSEKDPEFKANLEAVAILQDEFQGALWRLKSDANFNARKVS